MAASGYEYGRAGRAGRAARLEGAMRVDGVRQRKGLVRLALDLARQDEPEQFAGHRQHGLRSVEISSSCCCTALRS